MVQMLREDKKKTAQDELIQVLQSILNAYLDTSQINKIISAYEYAKLAHEGQFRKSGEAYICHPLSVAIILAEMRMDVHGIIAAILHDVVEDTSITQKELTHKFGKEVGLLVDGVTKLTKIDGRSKEETQAENVRKMFLAMAVDLRVIMVKLADRLHNMQTLDAMPTAKKWRIAKETVDIYIPIANRLNMNEMRHRLELLSFKSMYPLRFKVLAASVKRVRGNRKEIIQTIENSIKHRLKEMGLGCDVKGREKNIPSIYKKMKRKKIPFSDVFDVYAFRIFTETINSCYQALGGVHNLYTPIPGRFKDYIALVKANGYQALHTTLSGPYGVPIEIQIKTYDMHKISESGIAAHWLYKDDSRQNFQAQANQWLRELLEMQESAGNSLEFIENLKIDLFPQEIFVFTPQEGVIKLPRGATVVDFAYAIHTDIGMRCNSARIDKQLVPLQTQLENGMTVEVITASWARPSATWLNYAVTAKARTGIRHYLKHFKTREAAQLGKRLLEQSLHDLDLSFDEIPEEKIERLLLAMQIPSLDRLLEDIGLGNKMPFLVAKRIKQDNFCAAIKLDDGDENTKIPLTIKGTEGMVVTLARCCHPIPGDSIVGYFNPGKGVVVHHHACRNSRDVRKKQATWLDVNWCDEVTGEFSTEIRLEVKNQQGTLASIAAVISKQNSNIENVTVINQDDKVSVDSIILSVRNRVHLAEVMRELKKLSIVLKLTRIKA
ncbi:MAG: RelA/SpoT family protein [Methylococcales bacterium]|nr:RelA/SpoT family protein [Methylococcales bacterium]